MKKLLTLVLALCMVASLFSGIAEEAEKAYDLKGMTVKIRLWDSPNPYDPEVNDVDKEKWLPIYEAAKEKYNCEFAFYTPTVEYDEFTNEWLQSIAGGSPVWHITNNFSAMWLITMTAQDGLVDIKDALKTLNIPEQYKSVAAAGDGVYAFVTSRPGTEGLVYNKAMIEEAGMEYTPTEMFMNGTWSYNDFYDYMTTLQANLPEGTYAFFIDPNYWQIFASAGNNTAAVDNALNVQVTSDAYVETIEFLQKLWNAGVCREANVTASGGKDNWGTPSATFDKGVEVAMTHRATWQFGSLNSNGVDWGFVPYPWGNNVSISGDYTTLEGYKTAFYDYGCMGPILSGVENDFPGLDKDYVVEALVNLTYDLFVTAEKQAELAVAAAGAEEGDDEIDMRWFNYEDDAIVYDFILNYTIYNNSSTIGSFTECSLEGYEGTLYLSSVIRNIIYDNLPVRATLEAVAPQIEACLVENGLK